jgi:hypothetical protein
MYINMNTRLNEALEVAAGVEHLAGLKQTGYAIHNRCTAANI